MLDRILDTILMDVEAAYRHENARFRALELALFRPFADYEPDPFLDRLRHLEHHVLLYRRTYNHEPKDIDAYKRLFSMMPAFDTEYRAAYRKVSETIAFERFLNNLQWSRAFALSLASIYGVDENSSPGTCRGLLESRQFATEKVHLQQSTLGVVMQQVYGPFVQRHLQDLQRLFKAITGRNTVQDYLKAISSLEQLLQSSADGLMAHHRAKKLTFDRRSHYLDCVRELLKWFETSLCLSAEDLANKKAAGLFTVVDVQAHVTYQLAERGVLQEVFNALQRGFEFGHEDFNTYVADIRLGLREVVEYRDKMRKTAERLNKGLTNYIPEKYLQYLRESEEQYRKSVFFHFHAPVNARPFYPVPIYGQLRPDLLLDMVPEFKAQLEREQVYGAEENLQRLGSYLDEQLD